MVKITISIPKELKKEMEHYPEINWSVVVINAFREKLENLQPELRSTYIKKAKKIMKEKPIKIGTLNNLKKRYKK